MRYARDRRRALAERPTDRERVAVAFFVTEAAFRAVALTTLDDEREARETDVEVDAPSIAPPSTGVDDEVLLSKMASMSESVDSVAGVEVAVVSVVAGVLVASSVAGVEVVD